MSLARDWEASTDVYKGEMSVLVYACAGARSDYMAPAMGCYIVIDIVAPK